MFYAHLAKCGANWLLKTYGYGGGKGGRDSVCTEFRLFL